MKRAGMLLLCLFPLVSSATDYVPPGGGELRESIKEAGECFDLSNVSIPKCVIHFFDESNKELEATVNRIRQGLKKDLALFDETQAKWLAFRESECRVQSITARAFADPERQEWLATMACTAKLNAQRALQLKEIPLRCDSCLQ